MDEFGYLSVLFSIILGLALAQLVMGLGRIIQLRARVSFYWPALVWAFTLLVIDAQSWWAMFSLRRVHEWSFLGFGVVLLHPLALFLIATLAVPDASEFNGERRVALEENYFSHFRWFFGAILLAIVASLVRPLVLGLAIAPEDVVIQGFWFALALVAMAVKAKWYHAALAVVFPVTLALYIGGLFAHL